MERELLDAKSEMQRKLAATSEELASLRFQVCPPSGLCEKRYLGVLACLALCVTFVYWSSVHRYLSFCCVSSFPWRHG